MLSYLRVVATPRCSLACAYCHMEGDPAAGAGGLPLPLLLDLCGVAVGRGVRKLKLLGGEPLLRRDLPRLVGALRQQAPGLDLSLVTGGAVPSARLDDVFAAGLDRANLSLHGYGAASYRERTQRDGGAWALRQRFLEALLAHGRPTKLNYVWRGPGDDEDLAALLEHARAWGVVVGVLDELSLGLGAVPVAGAVARLRGPPARRWTDADPHSLPATRWAWGDGLVVELKTHRLGDVAPWRACPSCPARSRCGEGIRALRLTHDGRLLPCLDRPDLGVDLARAWRQGGADAARAAWVDLERRLGVTHA